MTQKLANRMTTAPDRVFVTCNPLQPQEEILAIDQMTKAQGGGVFIPLLIAGARIAAPHVVRHVLPALTGAAAAIMAYEWNSEESGDGTTTTVNVNVNNCNCDCDCCN